MGKSFIEKFKEGYQKGLEHKNKKSDTNAILTPQKQLKNLTILLSSVIIILVVVFEIAQTNKSNNVRDANANSKDCVGNENCISNVRANFNNSGKTILGEEYLGNGKFGISFMDNQHLGNAYNATVKTDCSCRVLDVNVSVVH